MNDEYSPGVALALALFEALLFGWVCAVIVGSFTGHVDALQETAVTVRVAGFLVAATFGAAPLWVFYDARRRGASLAWVHAVAMPLLNVIGLVAYLHDREETE